MDKLHVFTDDAPVEDLQKKTFDLLVNLLKSIGFSKEWAESFLGDLQNARRNPEEDKLEAELDKVNPVLDEIATNADEILVYIDNQLDTADEAMEEWNKQRAKEDLELLKIRLEEAAE